MERKKFIKHLVKEHGLDAKELRKAEKVFKKDLSKSK